MEISNVNESKISIVLAIFIKSLFVKFMFESKALSFFDSEDAFYGLFEECIFIVINIIVY